MPTPEEMTAEQLEMHRKNVAEHLAQIHPEQIDRVLDLIQKVSTFIVAHPNNSEGKTLNQLIAGLGNFAGLPTTEEIKANPKKFVPNLEVDLMTIFTKLHKGSA